MGLNTVLILTWCVTLATTQCPSRVARCSEYYQYGGHCATVEVGQPHLNSDDGVCTEERLCNQPLSKQFPPIVLPPSPSGGTLPPGLEIPCICCQDCQDTQCSVLPGHVCVREEIAREDRLVVLDSCQEDRCTPLPGQGTCLCCAVRNTTTTTTIRPATTETTTITSTTGETTWPASTTKMTTMTTTTGETPVVISSSTTMTTTTYVPTTTTPAPTCPSSTCCSATFLQGGSCTETRLLSKKEKKFCSKSKSCTNSIGVFDKKCTCCRNCKEHKTCKKKKGRCVDPATVNWAHWNFDFCYNSKVKCVKRRPGMSCVCCGWNNPGKPQLGMGQNIHPPVKKTRSYP